MGVLRPRSARPPSTSSRSSTSSVPPVTSAGPSSRFASGTKRLTMPARPKPTLSAQPLAVPAALVREREPAARQRRVGHLEGDRSSAPQQREERSHDRDQSQQEHPGRGDDEVQGAAQRLEHLESKAASRVARGAADAQLDAARQQLEQRRRQQQRDAEAEEDPAAHHRRPQQQADRQLDPLRCLARGRGDGRLRVRHQVEAPDRSGGHQHDREHDGQDRERPEAEPAQEEREAGGHVPRAGERAQHDPRAARRRHARRFGHGSGSRLAESFAP